MITVRLSAGPGGAGREQRDGAGAADRESAVGGPEFGEVLVGPVRASLDLPFAIEQPDELCGLVIAFADRLRASAMTR
jgi:hypothetical protein